MQNVAAAWKISGGVIADLILVKEWYIIGETSQIGE